METLTRSIRAIAAGMERTAGIPLAMGAWERVPATVLQRQMNIRGTEDEWKMNSRQRNAAGG
jgi:hypothetical protein